jgi:MoaA/NifB/PqqE/SkfB family radical SAM enzyme
MYNYQTFRKSRETKAQGEMIIMDKEQNNFDIQDYMTKGVERVVSDAIKATLKNPKESAFMVKFAAASKRASQKRRKAEDAGEHIPPFLIASITSQCNLHCAGCYSRCNHATVDAAPVAQLTSEEWLRIFEEADDLGISFILLAGGEPMLRRDIIEAAGQKPNILFPIFTNGTFMDERYFDLFDKRRNLIPIMSIEGEKEITDARRGSGIYDRLIANMDELHKRGLIFGASVTVTTENIKEVSSPDFLKNLSDRGCKVVIFVEFVPVTDDSKELAPGDAEREYLHNEILRLRREHPEMVYISFPGDEKSSGGCVAAGRGFFHINSHGGAEPCPFSPYSDINVRDVSLRDAMNSKLFRTLRENGHLLEDHAGGCVLYEKRELVERIMSGQTV